MNENEMIEKVADMFKDAKEGGNYVDDHNALIQVLEWARINEDEAFATFVGDMLDNFVSAGQESL